MKGRRKLLLLRRNITPVGKCWPRSSREPGWMWEPEGCPSRGLWWDGEAGASLGTHPIPQLQESPDSMGARKEQNLVKVLLGEGLGCCREPGAALGQAAFRISCLVANTTEVFST